MNYPDEYYEAHERNEPGVSYTTLVTVAELRQHLDAAEDDWDDLVLTAKLGTASDYVEGVHGVTGQYWQPRKLTQRWYGPTTVGGLTLVGYPHVGATDFTVSLRTPEKAQATRQLQASEYSLVESQGVGVVRLAKPFTLGDRDDFEVVTTFVERFAPTPIREAVMKLAASLVVDRTASTVRTEGEGIDFDLIDRMVAPFTVKRAA